MATFELYRRSTIGMCLTETLDEMVQNGTLSPELAIQVLVQFDKVQSKAVWRLHIFLDLCTELRFKVLFDLISFHFWLLQSMTEALESQVKSKVSIKVSFFSFFWLMNLANLLMQRFMLLSKVNIINLKRDLITDRRNWLCLPVLRLLCLCCSARLALSQIVLSATHLYVECVVEFFSVVFGFIYKCTAYKHLYLKRGSFVGGTFD